MRIIRFKKEHLDCMDIRGHEKLLLQGFGLEALEQSIAMTGIHDGRIIACGGVYETAFGGELWLIPSIYLSQYRHSSREARKWIEQVAFDLGLKRMQSSCVNDELHERWMLFLGFQKEGILRKYHNGVDYAMWSRLWE